MARRRGNSSNRSPGSANPAPGPPGGILNLSRWDLAAGGIMAAAAFALRLIYIWQIRAAGLSEYLRLDPLYYHRWALRIVGGEMLGTDVFEMSPLYAYLLALFYKLFGTGTLAPLVFQAAVGSLVCGLLLIIGRRAFGKAEGILAGGMLALYGPAIFYDGQIMKTSLETSLTALMAMALFLGTREGSRFRTGWIAAGGVLLGTTALMRENILVAAPIVFFWILWPRRRPGLRQRIVAAAALTGATVLPILPATLHNLYVARDPVLITSLGGENFYTGNNEVASGRYTPPPFVRPDPQYEHEDFRQEAARRVGRPLTRREANRYWFREGIRFIVESPGRFAWLLGDKLAVFFNDFERPDNFSYYNFKRFSSLLSAPLLHFAWIAPAGLAGLALAWRKRGELAPLYITLAAFLASALIFFTQSRYRMPSVPILALFAGFALMETARSVRSREIGKTAAVAAAILVLAFWMTRDPGNTDLFAAQNEALVAEMHLEAGDLEAAMEGYRACLEGIAALPVGAGVPGARVAANARIGLARALIGSGRLDDALEQLRQAASSPRPETRFGAYKLSALILLERDRLGAAGEAAARAIEIEPGDFEMRMVRAQVLDRTGRRGEALRELDEALRIEPGNAEAARIRDALRQAPDGP